MYYCIGSSLTDKHSLRVPARIRYSARVFRDLYLSSTFIRLTVCSIRRLVSSFQCSCLTNYTDVGLLLSYVLPIVDCLYCPDCSHRLWTSFPDFIGFYRASACYKHAERDIIMANLSVRLSVHCRYCVQTNGYIVAFCRSGIILVFPFSPQLQKFRGTP